MYAIVKTGGKQYRVEPGQTLLVERLREDAGAKVALQPLLYRSDEVVFAGAELEKIKVEATILGHERGPKLRIFKFKPKRGYKRTTGHRQELTRIEVTDIKLLARKPAETKAATVQDAAPVEQDAPARKPAAKQPAAEKPAAAKPAAKKPAAKRPAADKPAKPDAKQEDSDGA